MLLVGRELRGDVSGLGEVCLGKMDNGSCVVNN